MIKITLSRKLRVTQSELAAATGIRSNTINDLYHNLAGRVSIEQLDKICEALNCNLNEIVEFSPNKIVLLLDVKAKAITERPANKSQGAL